MSWKENENVPFKFKNMSTCETAMRDNDGFNKVTGTHQLGNLYHTSKEEPDDTLKIRDHVSKMWVSQPARDATIAPVTRVVVSSQTYRFPEGADGKSQQA